MSFTALAQQITAHAEVLDSYIAAHGLPRPSFESDGPLDPFLILSNDSDPEEQQRLHQSRTLLIDACQTVSSLALGPAASVVWSALSVGLPFSYVVSNHWLL